MLIWLHMQQNRPMYFLRRAFAIAILAAAFSAADLPAQQQSIQSTPTQVLAVLTVKDGVQRDQLMKVMPGEVRATVQLYLDGHIVQWFSRGDNKGVVFIVDCKTVEEAKSLLEGLPLLPLAQPRLEQFDQVHLARDLGHPRGPL